MRILPPEKTGTVFVFLYMCTIVHSIYCTAGPIPLLDKDPKTLKGMHMELLWLWCSYHIALLFIRSCKYIT